MTSDKAVQNGGAGRRTRTRLVPPDGGWGWMVVAGTASTNIFNQSMLSLFSLLYGDKIESMGYQTKEAAVVMSTMLFVTNFGGPMSGGFLKLTSPRTVAVTGSILCTAGIFLSAFTSALWHLIATYGILLGTGLGLIQTATFVSINGYFKGKTGRAVGLAMAGTGLGQMLMPFVIKHLLETYDFTGCCCILGAMSLHGFAGCLLLQPVEWHMKEITEEENNETKHLLAVDKRPDIERKTSVPLDKEEVVYNPGERRMTMPAVQLPPVPNGRKNSKTISYRSLNCILQLSNTNVPNATKDESTPMLTKENCDKPTIANGTSAPSVPGPKKSLVKRLTELFDVRLLASPRFLNVIIGTALSVTSIQNFSFIFPLFLKKSASLNMFQVATCMSTVAGMDIVGRLTLPSLADRFKVKARVTLILTSAWLIVVRQILVYQSTLIALVITAGLYGFGRSMIIVARNIAISENCRPDQVPSAVGWGMMATGIVVPPVGFFLGWLRDYTDSFVVCIYAQNILLLILIATWTPDLLLMRWRNKNKKEDVEM